MLEFLIASTIDCYNAKAIVDRVRLHQDLSDQVKSEIVMEIKRASESCDWDANVD